MDPGIITESSFIRYIRSVVLSFSVFLSVSGFCLLFKTKVGSSGMTAAIKVLPKLHWSMTRRPMNKQYMLSHASLNCLSLFLPTDM